MKKLVLLGVLSLSAVGLTTGTASAWFFDNWCGGCHGCRCTLNISYRPYNAFDPGCCGASINGNLCGLFGGMGCGPWVPPPCMPPCYSGMCGTSCINSGCCDAGCLPAPVPDSGPAPVPAMPAAPAGAAPVFTPPMPSPLPATSQMYYYPTPVAQNPVHPAGYYPNYYPGYYPNYQPGYYPPMQGYPTPSYPYGMPNYGQNYGR